MTKSNKEPAAPRDLFSSEGGHRKGDEFEFDDKSLAVSIAAAQLGAKNLSGRCEDLVRSVRVTDELLSMKIGI